MALRSVNHSNHVYVTVSILNIALRPTHIRGVAHERIFERKSDLRHYSLQNTHLAVDVIPGEGGRIASLKSVSSGMEFLTQSNRTGPYAHPGFDAHFQDGPCAGIEECLPTVGVSGADTPGGPAPDHGDYWQLVWDVTEASETQLGLVASGFSRTLRFAKKLILEHNMLRVEYLVENIGATPQSFLYACHPLFAISAGDRIQLPQEVSELKLDYSRNRRLGERGDIIRWPQARSGIDLNLTGDKNINTAEMFYTDRLNEGCCGIYRNATHQTIQVTFDTRRLPYLGVWLCYGGWPDDSSGPRQYAVALEPTTSACNTVADALRTNSAITLGAGEVFDWDIRFTIE